MAEITEPRKPVSVRAREVARRFFRHENAFLILILAAIIGVLAVLTGGKTITLPNVSNILLQSSIRGVASVGQLFVILTAGIDLSIGGLALMINMVGASFVTTELPMNSLGSPLAAGVAVPILLLLGLGIGVVNGLSVSRIGMPALIVTLAMWQIGRGVAYQLTGGHPIGGIPDSLSFLGQGTVAGLPAPVIVFIVVVVVAYLVLNYTTFGRSVYAVGGNPASSWLSGINVKNILLSVYVISGFLAGLAGIMTLSRTMSGTMLATRGLELDTVAAVVVGGVSLFGGRGNIIGVVLGAIILGVVTNGMVVTGLDPAFQDLVRGGIIFGAVAVDSLRRR